MTPQKTPTGTPETGSDFVSVEGALRQAFPREPVGRVGQWEIFYAPSENCYVIDMPGTVPTHSPEYPPAQFPTLKAAVAYAETLI